MPTCFLPWHSMLSINKHFINCVGWITMSFSGFSSNSATDILSEHGGTTVRLVNFTL